MRDRNAATGGIGIALGIAAAFGAVAMREASRGPATGVLAQGGGTAMATAEGEFWSDIAVRGVIRGAPRGTPGPVAGAWVILHSGAGKCEASRRTDADGNLFGWCHDVSVAGEIEVHVVATDHHVAVIKVTPDILGEGGHVETPGVFGLVIALTPQPPPAPSPSYTPFHVPYPYVPFAGTIVDAGGRPVAGARVAAEPNPSAPQTRCLSPVVSDALGRFELICPAFDIRCPVQLHYIAAGFAPAVTVVNASDVRDNASRRIVLTAATASPTPGPGTPLPIETATAFADQLPYVDVSGIVIDPAQADFPPVAGARVMVSAHPGRCGAPLVTGPDGRFAFRCDDLSWHGAIEARVVGPAGRVDSAWVRRFDLGRPGAWGSALRFRAPLQGSRKETPIATGTPPPLPDLVILSLGWRPERSVPTCARYAVPWFGFVTIANQGAASAGPFSVRAPRVSWVVDGMAAGETRVLVSPPSIYPDVPIVADPDNAVAESDETNNVYDPDPNHLWTPTSQTTQPPPCTATPTATPNGLRALLPWAGR